MDQQRRADFVAPIRDRDRRHAHPFVASVAVRRDRRAGPGALEASHAPREGNRALRHEILVVEGGSLDRELVERALEDVWLGGKYRLVANGREALDSMRDHGLPRLVVLDLGLPGRQAELVLREAKADPRLALVPIVVLAGRLSGEEVARVYALGAATCFAKPSTLDGFRDLVEMLVFYWFLIARVPARPEA